VYCNGKKFRSWIDYVLFRKDHFVKEISKVLHDLRSLPTYTHSKRCPTVVSIPNSKINAHKKQRLQRYML
jgi:hypothetical protein